MIVGTVIYAFPYLILINKIDETYDPIDYAYWLKDGLGITCLIIISLSVCFIAEENDFIAVDCFDYLIKYE